MSNEFRVLLKQVGSGTHTSQSLSREEAAAATRMMLQQVATPAQIGAFMIAHRIKRPTPDELAGMLDAYAQLGPRLPALPGSARVLSLGSPYDGRSRTAPVSPITALVLAAAGVPVLMHGGDRMPTKDGLPFIDIWRSLGLPLDCLSLGQVHQLLQDTGFGFVYLPRHFPAAHGLVPYRDQIGKRPPFATVELMWPPYAGPCHPVVGFVHPPTENMVRGALAQHGLDHFTTIKGMEGSCDVPRSRTAILGLVREGAFERHLLHPREYGFDGPDDPLGDEATYVPRVEAVLGGKPSEFAKTALWNSGVYLWLSGLCPTVEQGLAQAETLLQTGAAARKLDQIRQTVARLTAETSG